MVKIKSVKENVLLLETMQPLLGMTKDDYRKKLCKLYNFRNRGTDEDNKRSESHCSNQNKKKKSFVALYYV